jgi:hypothetical protein
MTHSRPLWLGGLIAPLAAPLALILVLTASTAFDNHSPGLINWPMNLVILLVGSPISYMATWIIGMPCVLWLRHSGRLSAFNLCAISIVLGGVMFGGMQWFSSAQMPVPPTLFYDLAVGAAFGLVVGVAFCLVAGIRARSIRPKKRI